MVLYQPNIFELNNHLELPEQENKNQTELRLEINATRFSDNGD